MSGITMILMPLRDSNKKINCHRHHHTFQRVGKIFGKKIQRLKLLVPVSDVFESKIIQKILGGKIHRSRNIEIYYPSEFLNYIDS